MPAGKPAGVPCVQLTDTLACRLFGQPGRPAVCASLRPGPEMCGNSRDEAWQHLTRLEAATRPTAPHADPAGPRGPAAPAVPAAVPARASVPASTYHGRHAGSPSPCR